MRKAASQSGLLPTLLITSGSIVLALCAAFIVISSQSHSSFPGDVQAEATYSEPVNVSIQLTNSQVKVIYSGFGSGSHTTMVDINVQWNNGTTTNRHENRYAFDGDGFTLYIDNNGMCPTWVQVHGTNEHPTQTCTVPTATPTARPTSTPTVRPTATPTVRPTATPTVKPTATPTVRPTSTPTVRPTATPTVKPTATPTVRPTSTPTVRPTATPRATDCPTPTVRPTSTPTVRPTATPTVKPTATPTVHPTSTPTVAPTSTPTVAPTATPVAPTATPAPTEVPKSTPEIRTDLTDNRSDGRKDSLDCVPESKNGRKECNNAPAPVVAGVSTDTLPSTGEEGSVWAIVSLFALVGGIYVKMLSQKAENRFVTEYEKNRKVTYVEIK